MNANRHKAVVELYSGSETWKEKVERVMASSSMTLEELEAATDEVLVSGNDIEGAAIGLAAVNQTYPNHDSDEYLEAKDRVLDNRCLLFRLQSESNFPWESELELKVDEMLDIIDDGAERIAAGCPLAA